MITREEYLTKAVELINSQVFNGDLDLINHGYRITWGKCPGKRLTECLQPYDGEDVSLDDFFPTTISVSYKIKDPYEMLTALAFECIHAFFNIKGYGKKFKKLAEKYYFDAPYEHANASDVLKDIINNIYSKLTTECGVTWEELAKPVIIYKPAQTEQKKSTMTLFCPECGMEYKVNRKKFEKLGGKLGTCGCGTKLGIDNSDDEEENTSNTEEGTNA